MVVVVVVYYTLKGNYPDPRITRGNIGPKIAYIQIFFHFFRQPEVPQILWDVGTYRLHCPPKNVKLALPRGLFKVTHPILECHFWPLCGPYPQNLNP